MINTKRILVKNIPKSLPKTEVIDKLKKLCHNSPLVTITIPISIPTDIELPSPETNIAFINVSDITQIPTYKNNLNNKLIGENKIQTDFYDVAKKPVVKPITTTTTTITTPKTVNNKPAAKANIETTKKLNNESNESKNKKVEIKEKKEETNKEIKKELNNNSNNKRKLDNAETEEKKESQETSVDKEVKVTKKVKKETSKNTNKTENKEENDSEDKVDGEDSTNTDESDKNKDNTTVTTTKQPTVRNNRKVITKVTQQLVFLSEKKDFQGIRNNYNYLKKIGAKPDHITFGVMLNACVRCQEYGLAKDVFNDALATKDGANEVVYTTYIKALCETDMNAAEKMIDQMKTDNINLNARSYNSILRGCIRSGDLAIANRLYADMLKLKFEDSTTIEYLVKIYAQHLMIPEIWKLLGEKYEQFENEMSPIVFSRLALAALLAGDLKSAVKALGIIDDIMTKAPKTIANASQSHKNQGKRSEFNKVSATLFERINRHEINEESDKVRSCLQHLVKQQRKLKCLPMEQSKRVHFSPITFANLYKDIEGMEENKSFLEKLFVDSKDQQRQRQVKMEICSGHGHWITKRAAQDLDADWISVEIRYDRVFQIWSKLILDSIDNLYVMAGEANSALKNNVPNESLDEVYINYPNPPVWPGAQRLINHDFLVDINRTLKKDGTLTIVTDDQPYAQSIVQLLKQSRKLGKIYKPVKEDYICQLEEDYGYSYFNKLWSNGQRMKRYCIYVIKD